jgi:hypothetical protein
LSRKQKQKQKPTKRADAHTRTQTDSQTNRHSTTNSTTTFQRQKGASIRLSAMLRHAGKGWTERLQNKCPHNQSKRARHLREVDPAKPSACTRPTRGTWELKSRKQMPTDHAPSPSGLDGRGLQAMMSSPHPHHNRTRATTHGHTHESDGRPVLKIAAQSIAVLTIAELTIAVLTLAEIACPRSIRTSTNPLLNVYRRWHHPTEATGDGAIRQGRRATTPSDRGDGR